MILVSTFSSSVFAQQGYGEDSPYHSNNNPYAYENNPYNSLNNPYNSSSNRIIRDEDGRAALLHFLLNLDIKDFNAKSPAPMSSAKQEMIDDNKSDFESWLEQIIVNIYAIIGREIFSSEELANKYTQSSGNKCSSKTVSVQLSKKGIKRLKKQAKLANGKRIRIYALTNRPKYEAKTDKELGDIIEAKLNWHS